MDKKEIVEKLNELKKNGAEIAEVKVDISNGGMVKHADESILVRLVENPTNEDCIKNENHWELFDNIKEFEDNTYFRHSADKSYRIDYISDFKSISVFATDYAEMKVAI